MARAKPKPPANDLLKMNERLIAQVNNLSLEMEQRMEGGQLSEALSDLDWANRVDRDYLWIRTSGANAPQFRYMTKEIIDMYADIANFMYVYNPLIRRVVDVKTQFTFALDYSITSESGQDVIDEIKDDPLNDQGFFGHQVMSEIDGELQRAGNVFIAIWPDKKQVRAWSSYEIRDVVLDPEDATRPIFYIRSWLDEVGKEYRKAYPSVFAQDSDMPSGKTELSYLGQKYEIDRSAVVYHMSAKKGIKQKFALSELVATCRWAKPHEKFLEDFAAIVSALRKYSHLMTTKGTAAQASAIAGQFAGDTAQMGTPLQSNPVGSLVVAQEGNELKVVDAGSGKIIGIEGARQFLLMVSASSGVPETYLTMDPSTGNLATAKQISPVFIMLIQDRQTAWKNALTIIFKTLLESGEFEVSFPPIRDNIDAYIANMNSIARTSTGGWTGALKAKDYIKAGYEALEWKLPEDDELDAMAAELESSGAAPETPPGTDQGLSQIALAAQGLTQAAQQQGQQGPVEPEQPVSPALQAYQNKKAALEEALRWMQEAGDDVTWITINGMHIPVKPGETPNDAIQRAIDYRGGGTPSSGASKGDSVSAGKKTLFKTYDKAGLNKDQIKAIDRYKSTSSDDYEKINTYIRSGKVGSGDDPEMESTIKNLDSSFTERVPQGTTIYKGQKSEFYSGVGKTQGSQLLNAKVGETFDDKDYQSFSTDPEVARGFAKGIGEKTRSGSGKDHVVLKLVGDGDTPCINIGGSEKEVLLPRGKTFEIVDKKSEKTGGIAVFHTITVRIKK